MQKYDYVELKLPAKAQYIGVARLALSGIANRVGFSYEAIEDLKIAMSEAVTNAVEHAYSDDAQSGEVVIGCGLYEDRIEIMVADEGKSFDFEEVRQTTGPYDELVDAEVLREGGLGLYLMEALMDEVRFHHEEGVTVFMTKYLDKERGDENVKEQQVFS